MSTKPDDISQEALNAAEALTNEWFFLDRHSGAAQAIALAIMAAEKRGEEREREACAETARRHLEVEQQVAVGSNLVGYAAEFYGGAKFTVPAAIRKRGEG